MMVLVLIPIQLLQLALRSSCSHIRESELASSILRIALAFPDAFLPKFLCL